MDLITVEEATTLAEARSVLRAIELRAEGAAREAASSGADLGRVAAMADAAEDAVFGVLNTAASYLGDQVAVAFSHARTDVDIERSRGAVADRERAERDTTSNPGAEASEPTPVPDDPFAA